MLTKEFFSFYIFHRERNRIVAKNSRERKKEEVRELQESLAFFKRKNKALENELSLRPSFVTDQSLMAITFDSEFSARVLPLLEALRHTAGSDSSAFYVINAACHFFPIIFASPAFAELSGYPMHEIVGQNCGFLSGLQTSRNEVS